MKIERGRYSSQKPDPYWRGARIAARILRRSFRGIPLSTRDRRVAGSLLQEEGISNRLIDQATACLQAPKKF